MGLVLNFLREATIIKDEFAEHIRDAAELDADNSGITGFERQQFVRARIIEWMPLKEVFKQALLKEARDAQWDGKKPAEPIEILEDVINLHKIKESLEHHAH